MLKFVHRSMLNQASRKQGVLIFPSTLVTRLTVTPFSVANLHESTPHDSCDIDDDEKRISSN